MDPMVKPVWREGILLARTLQKTGFQGTLHCDSENQSFLSYSVAFFWIFLQIELEDQLLTAVLMNTLRPPSEIERVSWDARKLENLVKSKSFFFAEPRVLGVG